MNKIDAIPHLKAGKVLSNSVENGPFGFYMESDGNIYKTPLMFTNLIYGSDRPVYGLINHDLSELCELDKLPDTGWEILFDNEKSS